ncbi:NAD(P)/FAD-dependent oxidoreductase [Castellaniella sp. UC4442_H9]|jgi:NADH dehydrogenase|nr:NAD(P)/FAD-dependent oxidoreductase [Gemmatimonadales bacterium]
MRQHAHRVVIVGGGAGGLELAARLGHRFGPENVILIDKVDSHIWKPSLHEVAAGTLDVHREALSYFTVARDCGFTFLHGSIRGIDRDTRHALLAPVHEAGGEQIFPARTVPYDTLVLAIGSKSNFFGTPGASQYAFALDSTADAEHFRQNILRALALLNGRRIAKQVDARAGTPEGVDAARDAAADDHTAVRQNDALNIAIVGGGATGVELAAELVDSLAGLAYYGMEDLHPARDVAITVLEGGDRILAALPEKVSSKAQQLLLERGIIVKTSVRVAAVHADCLEDSEGHRYPADLCVWAAGIEAPSILSELGLEANRRHQIVVDERLQASDPHILAFGDCAQAPWAGQNQSLPAKAQVASQQAAYLYDTLQARIKGHPPGTTPFRFRDHGSLVSIGRSDGLGSLMGVLFDKRWFVEGLLARLMYMSLHLRHHLVVLGVVRTGAIALGRLLLNRGNPRVKLH